MDGESSAKAEYSLPGVLYYLQQEWKRFERERNEWVVERAMLQTRITALESERKSTESLKADLLKRVQMLEYSLRQERKRATGDSSTLGATAGAGEPPNAPVPDSSDVKASVKKPPSGSGDSSTVPQMYHVPSQAARAVTISSGRLTKSRQILQKYLEEMGHADDVLFAELPKRSSAAPSHALARDIFADNAAGPTVVIPRAQFAAAAAAAATTGSPSSTIVSTSTTAAPPAEPARATGGSTNVAANQPPAGSKLVLSFSSSKPSLDDDDEEESPAKPAAASKEPAAAAAVQEPPARPAPEPVAAEPDVVAAPAATPAAEPEQPAKADAEKTDDDFEKDAAATFGLSAGKMGKMMRGYGAGKSSKSKSPEKKSDTSTSSSSSTISPSSSSSLMGLFANAPSKDSTITASSTFGGASGSSTPASSSGGGSDPLKLDELADVSLSETNDDGTEKAKLWALKHTLRGHYDAVRSIAFSLTNPVLFTGSDDSVIHMWRLVAASATKKGGSSDMEPVYSFRGCGRSVLCLATGSVNGEEVLLAGDLDGVVRLWKVPSQTIDLYGPFTANYLLATLTHHTDAVWDVKLRGDKALSASADGTVAIWMVSSSSSGSPSIRTIAAPANGAVPTSACFVADGTAQVAVAYSDSSLRVYDAETGAEVASLASAESYDGTVRTQINKVISHPTKPILITAHEDKYIRAFDVPTKKTISSVVAHRNAVATIAVNPSGSHLMSGGHDASMRGWEVDTFSCVQEFSAHRTKYDEAILAVAFHQKEPMLASAGADGTVRVYQ